MIYERGINRGEKGRIQHNFLSVPNFTFTPTPNLCQVSSARNGTVNLRPAVEMEMTQPWYIYIESRRLTFRVALQLDFMTME